MEVKKYLTDQTASAHGCFKSFFSRTSNSDSVSVCITETIPNNEESASIIDDYPTLSKTFDRYSVSYRAGVAMLSAVLHNIKTKIPVTDKSKLHRERKKMRESITKWTEFQKLFVDGGKDKT